MINTTIATISPKKAKEMLAINCTNRPINEAHVNFLAKEIEAGNWKVNGESIKVGKDKLIDGQHRLSAIIQANKSMRTVVMTGVDDDVFDTVDTGRNRTGSDILSLSNEKYANNLAALIKGIHRYYVVGWGDKSKMSNTVLERLLELYPKSRDAVAVPYRASGLFSPKIIHLCYFVFDRINHEEADDFISKLCSGVNLPARSPIHALRNKIISARLSGSRFPFNAVMVMTMKTWNLCREGKSTTRLSYKAGEKMVKAK